MSEKNAQTHAFGAEIAKVLQLMIHSLYTNKDIFLRELISNASDACDKLRYEALTRPELLGEDAALGITLKIDKEARIITIADNGIGMTEAELISQLGTIAKSGTQEFLESLSGDAKRDRVLIGQFGVGFYSSFMVADRVEVISRKAGEEKAYRWESEGKGEFTVEPVVETQPRGTQIILHMKSGEDDYLDAFRLKHIIGTYSDHIAFPITLAGDDGADVINRGSALWMKPKADVTEEQYQEFYRHVAHSPDQPYLTMHAKVEGKVEFSYLLYIPSMKPFDLFHPDRRRRVKLYVKRVFITDEGVDLVPPYMRFLRGVIDSEDLPLNISRETLQANPVLARIKETAVKRVLGELKKDAEARPEAYEQFWRNFGPVLKEGLCEATSPREQILEISRFTSDKSGDKLIGLEDYIAQMKPGQETIYYLTGERLETIKQSPQLEGFRRRGIDVLLLTDSVDDFWLSVVQDYKGKKFQSASRSDVDLSTFAPEQKEGEETPAAEPAEAGMEALIAACKTALGEHVRDVRMSARLEGSPVCLSVEAGGMDSRLEKFLIEQRQLPGWMPKILELNARHPVIRALAQRAGSGDDTLNDAVWLLFDQAKLMEGETLSDPAAFARRLSAFMQRGLAA